MGFNIKNNYGPNIEVNAGGKVMLVQGENGMWHTADSAEVKEYAEVTECEVVTECAEAVEEPGEERFHFVHPEIEDDEAWHIHNAVKRVVRLQGIQMICQYLTQLKKEKKLLLPPNPSSAYSELVRMGMPDGEGFKEATFRKYYNKA